MSDQKHEGDGYWGKRSGWKYYRVVKGWLESYQSGGSLCDVGGHDTPISSYGDFDTRLNITRGEVVNRLPDVRYVIGDFMSFDKSVKFDVVTCLQVMEHLDDETVKAFAKKLLQHAEVALIVSVPYLWAKGQEPGHLQDPVDREKLFSWMGREPDDFLIVDDGVKRIVARYNKV